MHIILLDIMFVLTTLFIQGSDMSNLVKININENIPPVDLGRKSYYEVTIYESVLICPSCLSFRVCR